MTPLPRGEALAFRKAQKIPHGGRNSLGDFSLPEMKALGSHISAFIVCHSLQKSSTAQKVYKPDRKAFAGLNLSVSADALPPPLPRGGLGSPRKVNGFARGSPTRGAVERSETERLYEGEPDRKH